VTLTVSVVIPTRDRCASLERTLRAVLADEGVDEVVVVDDASTDGTEAMLRTLAKRDPRVVTRASGGRGAAEARQVGAEAATGDVLLVLDDDVVPLPGLAAGHRRHHEAADNTVVIGYMPTIAPRERVLDTVGIHIYASDYETQVRRYDADPGQVLLDLWGGNMSLRRVDALSVGLRGDHELHGHEDKDFGLRCAEAGMRGVFDRALAAEHHPTRPFDAYLRLAHAQGKDLVQLHAAHPELGPLDLSRIGAELPAAARLAMAPATVPVLGALELRALRLAVRVLSRPRMRRAQTGAAVLARAIARRRGVREAQRA
jgi:hypothetical protein